MPKRGQAHPMKGKRYKEDGHGMRGEWETLDNDPVGEPALLAALINQAVADARGIKIPSDSPGGTSYWQRQAWQWLRSDDSADVPWSLRWCIREMQLPPETRRRVIARALRPKRGEVAAI